MDRGETGSLTPVEETKIDRCAVVEGDVDVL